MPERIEPGKPQQNGRHERMHLTLLQDTADPPARSLRAQLERLRDFQRRYNEERPHQALDHATPAECYTSRHVVSTASCVSRTMVEQEVRRVRHNGEIKWQGRTIYISAALVGEPVGLGEDATGWAVSYGPIVLGRSPWRAIGCKNPNPQAMDLRTTLRVAHRVHSLATATTDLNK